MTRLGTLVMALLFQAGRRRQEHLDELVQSGLLERHEAETLRPLGQKPKVVAVWLTRLWMQALKGKDLRCSPIPHAGHVAPLIMERCLTVKQCVARTLLYLNSQLPFAYVHLLAITVDVANVVSALATGVAVAGLLFPEVPISLDSGTNGANASADDGDALLERHMSADAFNVAAIIFMGSMRVVAFNMVYGGLLAIGAALSNPLASSPIGLPGLNIRTALRNECETFCTGIDAIDGSSWWLGVLDPACPAHSVSSSDRAVEVETGGAHDCV